MQSGTQLETTKNNPGRRRTPTRPGHSLRQLLLIGAFALALLSGALTLLTHPARATGLPESNAPELQITESLPGDESGRVEARAVEPASISPISDPAFAGLRLTNPARLPAPVATNLSSRQVGPGETLQGLPADAWQRIMESIRQDRYRIKPNLSQAGLGYRATNHSQQLQAAFHPEGLNVTAVRPPRRPAGQRPAQRAGGAPTDPTTAAPHSLAVGPRMTTSA